MTGDELADHLMKHIGVELQKAARANLGCMVPIVVVIGVIILGVKSMVS